MPVSPVVPSLAFQDAFMEMLDDFNLNDPHNTGFYAPAVQDFAAYVQSLLDEESGMNLRDGWVPCTHRWLVNPEGAIVGVARLRHCLDTLFLMENAGHIGYDIAPAHRGRGYGHLALRAALAEARGLGLEQVLLYAAAENKPSRAVIERAGGVLESEIFSEFWNEPVCKYWIPLGGMVTP